MHKSFQLMIILIVLCNSLPAFALNAPELNVLTSSRNVSLFWTPVSGATSYTLHYAPFPFQGEHTIGQLNMGPDTSFTTTLRDGDSYYVAITANDGTAFDESAYSNIGLFTINGTPTPVEPSCDVDNLSLCDSADCSGAGGYWYDSTCNSVPKSEECDSSHLDLCASKTIINDMLLPHEGQPHGVPLDWDWSVYPRINMGNNPGLFESMTAWGQVYEDAETNPATNTRVQIRNIKSYLLNALSGDWILLQNSQTVEGKAYVEDFDGDENITPDVRLESDGGGISITTGNGYNFHFYPPGRVEIKNYEIAGIFTTVEARLVVDNLELPDDRGEARYLLNMGGDYWLNQDAKWLANQVNNDDIAIGRFKYVSSEWASFNMTTLSEDEILLNPPPIN